MEKLPKKSRGEMAPVKKLREDSMKKPILEDTSRISARILSVKWEVYDKAGGILTLTFKGNKSYQYHPVSKELTQKMLASESLGKFFDSNINNKVPYRKLGEV